MKKVNRKHKDRLFLRVFSRREDLLSLYNAVNGSHYTDLEELEITTLDDVIYMSMKNDVSFLLGDVLNLWEHQSSYNPNMPVRGLSYFAKLYQKYVEQHKINIYSSSLKKLPFPQYIVFYNGLAEEPDRIELKLSDAFEKRNVGADMEPCLEVRAVMLNINYGKNRDLMEQCQWLREYAQFIDLVRDYCEDGLAVEEAVDAAVDLCIQQGVLADILSSHRAEVIAMFLTDYDEQRHMEMERDEWLEDGIDQGIKQGIKQGIDRGRILKLIELSRKMLDRNMTSDTIAELVDEDIVAVKKICDMIQAGSGWSDDEICEKLG